MIRPTLLAIAIAQALAVPCVQAATIEVNNSGDAGVGCTLREAVTSINDGNFDATTDCSNIGEDFGIDDQISFSVATVSLSNGELDINKDLSIDGGSDGVIINGDGSSRILRLDASGTHITLDKLTLSGGSTSGSGGAIYAVDVNLNLSNSTLSGNSADLDGGGLRAVVGSILSLRNSTISGNSASFGGGIAAYSSRVSLTNSTVSSNSADGGGGIFVRTNSSVNLNNSTVSENSASNVNGGIYALFNSSMSLSNSIVANSVGADCFIGGTTTITADNHDLIEDGSCATSALSVDPKLGPLTSKGGPTKTHALLAGSPAIDAGDNAACAAPPVNNRDQRGGVRPVGSACDIGSYEFGAEVEISFIVAPLPDGKGGYYFISL